MPAENFNSLVPDRNDTPEIIRAKHAQAAARVIEPAEVGAFFVEVYGYGGWESIVGTPTWFRKALIWGGHFNGTVNLLPLRLRHGSNDQRVINPGEMVVIEAMPGQKFNLQYFQMAVGYYGDGVCCELY